MLLVWGFLNWYHAQADATLRKTMPEVDISIFVLYVKLPTSE